MPIISYRIPTAKLARFVKAITDRFDYQDEIPDPNYNPGPDDPLDPPMIPNPETKRKFTERIVRQEIARLWRVQEDEEDRKNLVRRRDQEVTE